MADPHIGALQGAMAVLGNYKRRVDGIVGSETEKGVQRDPESALKWARTIGGKAVEFVNDVIDSSKRVVEESRDVIRIITEVAEEFNVPLASALAKGAIESGFRPDVVNNAGYSGVFQMGKPAWTDARKWLERNGRADVGDFDTFKLDTRSNARAAFAYRSVLMEQLERLGEPGPYSDAVLYLAHQQGAAGYTRLARVARGGKVSLGGTDEMVKAMKSNPPQDGKGATFDPTAFIARWEDVFALRTRQYA